MLVFLIPFSSNLFFSWVVLELFSYVFLLHLFLSSPSKENPGFLIYLGLMNIFSSVVLMFSILNQYDLAVFLSLSVKMGCFPLLDWIQGFCLSNSWDLVWVFFSLKKVLPLFFISFYTHVSMILLVTFFVLNLFFSIQSAFLVKSFFSLVCWSAVSSTGFFVLLGGFCESFFSWFFLLLIYSLNLFFVLLGDSKGLKVFWLTVVLFGLPPISLFLFKVVLFSFFQFSSSLLLSYIFTFLFYVSGLTYFKFYYCSSFLLSLGPKLAHKNSFMLYVFVFSFLMLKMFFFFV